MQNGFMQRILVRWHVLIAYWKTILLEQSTIMFESSFEHQERSTIFRYSIFFKLILVCEIIF